MLIDSFTIYKCPECSFFVNIPKLMSGNTFGAELFSDGKQNAPMMPEFSKITKCLKCKTIFWNDNQNEYGNYGFESEEMKQAKSVKYLSLEDLITVLQTGFYKNEKQELYVRRNIWWLFNDRIRNQQKQFTSVSEKDVWTENLNCLIRILESKSITHLNDILKFNKEMKKKYGFEDESDTEHDKNSMKREMKAFLDVFEERIAECSFEIAEIYRNLGDFETCHEILNNVETLDGLRFKEQMIRENEKKNDKVFRLR